MNNKQLILTVIIAYGCAVLYLKNVNGMDPNITQYFTEQGFGLR